MKNFSLLLTALSAWSLPMLVQAFVDVDEDGMSDVYAAHYGLAAGSANEDEDGDGQQNVVEWAWGTDPLDNESYYRPVSGTAISGVFDFGIPTTPGKYYQFQGTPDLSSGSWANIDAPFVGTGNVEHMLTSLPISGTNAFFWRVLAVGDADADGDGLSAFEEALLGTHDYSSDSDQDGVSDLDEFLAGLNPATAIDSDGNGIPDDWESFHGLTSPTIDEEPDGLNNLQEYVYGTDPNDPDTDGDGLKDGSDVAAGQNPLKKDHPLVAFSVYRLP